MNSVSVRRKAAVNASLIGFFASSSSVSVCVCVCFGESGRDTAPKDRDKRRHSTRRQAETDN